MYLPSKEMHFWNGSSRLQVASSYCVIDLSNGYHLLVMSIPVPSISYMIYHCLEKSYK